MVSGCWVEQLTIFANLRPICSQLQDQANQRLLTALICAHSPVRRHRAPSTAAQNRGALRGRQDTAPALACGNVEPRVGVGAVEAVRRRWPQLKAVQAPTQ